MNFKNYLIETKIYYEKALADQLKIKSLDKLLFESAGSVEALRL